MQSEEGFRLLLGELILRGASSAPIHKVHNHGSVTMAACSSMAECSLHSRLVASESALPEVYTTAEPPFSIVFANRAWESLCGWKAGEVIGMTCGILQGERTCKHVLHQVS